MRLKQLKNSFFLTYPNQKEVHHLMVGKGDRGPAQYTPWTNTNFKS